MDKDKKTKSKILITLLILITVCCIAITVWQFFSEVIQKLYFHLTVRHRKRKRMQKKLKMTILKK